MVRLGSNAPYSSRSSSGGSTGLSGSDKVQALRHIPDKVQFNGWVRQRSARQGAREATRGKIEMQQDGSGCLAQHLIPWTASIKAIKAVKRGDTHRRLSDGLDPGATHKRERQAVLTQPTIEKRVEAGPPVPVSFESVERERFAKHQPQWASIHAHTVIRRPARDVFPWIGSKPISSITPPDLLQVIKRAESQGAIETTACNSTADRSSAAPWRLGGRAATRAWTCTAHCHHASPNTSRR